jgi:hypothetical protein
MVDEDLARPLLPGDRGHVFDRPGEVRVGVPLESAASARPVAVLAFDDPKVQATYRHLCTLRCRPPALLGPKVPSRQAMRTAAERT